MLKNIKNLLVSLFTVFKHLFKRPITLEYPEKKKPVGEHFRGKPTIEGCIKCGTCLKVCPTKAITIENNEFKIDLKRCIFCGNCAFYCPVSAIKMSDCYELATDNVNNLSLKYDISENIGGEDERNI